MDWSLLDCTSTERAKKTIISTMSCLRDAEKISNKTFFRETFRIQIFHVVMLFVFVFSAVIFHDTKKISMARITHFHDIEKISMGKMTRSSNHDHERFVLVSFVCSVSVVLWTCLWT